MTYAVLLLLLFTAGYAITVKAAGVPDGFPLSVLANNASRMLRPRHHVRHIAARVMKATNRDAVVGVRGDVLIRDRIVVHLSDADYSLIAPIADWFCSDISAAIKDDAYNRGHKLNGPINITVERSALAVNGRPNVFSTFGDVTNRSIDPRDRNERTQALAAMLRLGDRIVPLPANNSMTVGRDESCDISIDDPMVSSRHLTLRAAGAGVVVEDLASANGTWVNERRTRLFRVVDGDVIRAGQTRITVQIATPNTGPDELTPTELIA